MGTFVAYTGVCSIALLLLFPTYKLISLGLNRPRLNRALILGISALSLVLWPTLSLIQHIPDTAGVVNVGPTTATLIADGQPYGSVHIWPLIVIGIYYVGLAIVSVRAVAGYLRLRRIVRNGRVKRCEGYILVIVPDNISPFSWNRYVVMSESDYACDSELILSHELQHIRSGHYVDLLAMQSLCVVLWYNPIMWIMLAELKNVHEVEADARVLADGIDLRQYQMLLIKKAVGGRFPSLANSLNHSNNLKFRITMMYVKKSSRVSCLRALALAPAMVAAVFTVNIPAVASGIEIACNTDMTVNYGDKVTQSQSDVQAVTSEEVVSAAEKMPSFPGGDAAMLEYLRENVQYPAEAIADNAEGYVLVQFVVMADGSIGETKVLRGKHPALDAEAIRVVKSMPRFTPGYVDGKPVNVWFTLPISFKLQADKK